MSTLPRRRPAAGFTLLELLIGAAVTTMIVAALSDAMGMFGRQVEQVRAASDKGPQEAVALMTDMARYGWSVEEPTPGQLDIVDALGGRTSFVVENGALTVTRPSGASGVLLNGVASLAIESDNVPRLREAAPLDDFRSWWERPSSGTLAGALALESGLPVALGFTMSSDVPDDYDVVSGVDEHVVEGTLQTLVINLSYVGSIPDDPNEAVVGDGTPGNPNKVDICHVPPGNPENAHTLSVNENAVDAHLAHGDTLGPCAAPPEPPPAADLVFSVYEARAPDDARPYGQALASMNLVTGAIPVGSASWVLTEMGEGGGSEGQSPEEAAATTPDGKVVMCHVPPGNPSNAHSIEISPSAVSAHLAHGDYYGCCGQHESAEAVYTLAVSSTPTEVAIDLSPLGIVLEPGRAYTLVMELNSPGFIMVGGQSSNASANSGAAQKIDPDGALLPMAASIPFRLEGMQRITQTAEHTPISRVSVTLATSSGQSASGSASVTSQVSVPGLWKGVVPGQTEVLEQ